MAHRDKSKWGWGLAALLGALLLVPAVAYARSARCGGPKDEAGITRAVARFSGVFGVPVELGNAIASIESSYHPQCVNQTTRAVPLGGAWGPMQVTLTTAKGIAERLAKNPNPLVQATLKKWTGKGKDLFDPEVGVMFGMEYLGRLWREFKTFERTAAAYHQGPQKIRNMIAAGQAIPQMLPPKGKAYVAMATKARGAVA